mgnify:CR=1 FL=1
MKINKKVYTSDCSVESLKDELITAKELKEIMHCGLTRAYDLLKSPAFPSTKIGGRYYVTASALKKWLERYENRTFII